MLYQHLVTVVLDCSFVSGKNKNKQSIERGERIIALAVNFAFKSCIQEDTEGVHCRDVKGYLARQIGSGGNRQKLYSCISTLWLDQLGRYNSMGCKGDPRNQVDVGLRMAIDSGATVGFPPKETYRASWLNALGSWNVPILLRNDFDGTSGHMQCPNRNNRAEYLCTSKPLTQQAS